MVKVLATLEEYKTQIATAVCISPPPAPRHIAIDSSPQPLVVIDFTATWCGPCKIISPIYENMAKEFPSVVFTKIDVDANAEAAEQCGIQAMPTFQFYKGGQKVGEMKGANESALRVSFSRRQRFSEYVVYVNSLVIKLLFLIPRIAGHDYSALGVIPAFEVFHLRDAGLSVLMRVKP
jgi:thioredoxin 1